MGGVGGPSKGGHLPFGPFSLRKPSLKENICSSSLVKFGWVESMIFFLDLFFPLQNLVNLAMLKGISNFPHIILSFFANKNLGCPVPPLALDPVLYRYGVGWDVQRLRWWFGFTRKVSTHVVVALAAGRHEFLAWCVVFMGIALYVFSWFVLCVFMGLFVCLFACLLACLFVVWRFYVDISDYEPNHKRCITVSDWLKNFLNQLSTPPKTNIDGKMVKLV